MSPIDADLPPTPRSFELKLITSIHAHCDNMPTFIFFSHAFAAVVLNMTQVQISPAITHRPCKVWLENTILP